MNVILLPMSSHPESYPDTFQGGQKERDPHARELLVQREIDYYLQLGWTYKIEDGNRFIVYDPTGESYDTDEIRQLFGWPKGQGEYDDIIEVNNTPECEIAFRLYWLVENGCLPFFLKYKFEQG